MPKLSVKPNRKRVALNMKTTEAVRAQLEEAARASGRSLTSEVEWLVERALERQAAFEDVNPYKKRIDQIWRHEMSNAVAPLEPSGIVASVAQQYGMHPKRFEETLRATVVGDCTKEELAAFLIVAREYELNPILREIYAFPKRGGGIQPIVGVDGWAKMMSRHPQADGMSFEDRLDNDMNLVSVTCRIYRKDRAHPIEATEYLAECKRNTDVWRQWPRRMLRHKAMIQAARYAFGFSGVIDPDEYDRFGASPHDPVTLQEQMRLTGPDQGADNERASPLDDDTEQPGHITTHPDYVQGQRDYKAGRGEPHFEIEQDEARLALWRQGYFAAVGHESEP